MRAGFLVLAGVILILAGALLVPVAQASRTSGRLSEGERLRLKLGLAGVLVAAIASVPGWLGVSRDSNRTQLSTSATMASTSATSSTVSAVPDPTTATTVGIPPTSAPAKPQAAFESPLNGALVSSSGGIQAKGTLANIDLEKYRLWLMDYDGNDYTVDQQAKIIAYRWSAQSAPVGDIADKPPFSQTVVIVLASPRCEPILDEKLRAADSTLSALPFGCTVLAERTVTVNRP